MKESPDHWFGLSTKWRIVEEYGAVVSLGTEPDGFREPALAGSINGNQGNTHRGRRGDHPPFIETDA